MVERSIDEFSLPPDAEQAVRKTVSFLQYWGEATTAELVDGCYSESPAGYDTADRWWSAGDRFGRFDSGTVGYENTPVVETPDDEDGRDVPDPDSTTSSFATASRNWN